MEFLRLAHDIMVLLEWRIVSGDGIDNGPERERRQPRKEAAEATGGNWVATALQRFTVRPLKFIRRLRNFVYREVP